MLYNTLLSYSSNFVSRAFDYNNTGPNWDHRTQFDIYGLALQNHDKYAKLTCNDTCLCFDTQVQI